MKTVRLKRAKINGRKHLLYGKTDVGNLFVIRYLVSTTEKMNGFKTFYKREKIKISDNVFHVTDETFRFMMAAYFANESQNHNFLPKSFGVVLNYE
jgi:hypothetical protein